MKKLLAILINAMFTLSMAISCTLSSAIPGLNLEKENETKAIVSNAPLAEVKFDALIPPNTPPDDPVFLELLDEISGINSAPIRLKMVREESGKYSVGQNFPLGSIIKYRYSHTQGYIKENNALPKAERYRLYHVEGSAEVCDIISSWKDIQNSSPMGRINGLVIDIGSSQPIPDIYVSAGGISTLTASDGSFVLDGLPEGTHNLVAYSLDGVFETFQQGAMVSPGSITPAEISMVKSKLVNITFQVNAPQSELKNLPIRLAANTYELGNTFSEQFNGSSVLASRSPLLTIDSEGQYSLQLILPVGFDFQYKYTLGDGNINTEYDGQGNPLIRQLIVPDIDTIIEDKIVSWNPIGTTPTKFLVKAPENTPIGDTVSLQIYQDNWLNPIPMWSLGDNHWLYVLFNPKLNPDIAGYRYCRNDQCGKADDLATIGKASHGMPIAQRLATPDQWDEIQSWVWWPKQNEQTQVIGYEVVPRGPEFIAGIEISPNEQPYWNPYLNSALQNIKSLGSNWVIMTPSASYTSNNPPILETVIGIDPLWVDTIRSSQIARDNQLKVALFPQVKFNMPAEIWWQQAIRDDGWWQNFFDRYQVYILHQADLAAQSGAEMLILGDPGILPSLGNFTLIDGSPSGSIEDANARWEQMIPKIRERYSGKLAWALSFPQGVQNPPGFISNFDLIYILFSPQLDSPPENYALSIDKLLDDLLLPFYQNVNKPIFLGLQYPSSDIAPDGCEIKLNSCWTMDNTNRSTMENVSYPINLSVQLDIYSAILYSINQRPWVSGVISRGFYPPVALMDSTSSVHGKPAAGALWYWFPRFLLSP